MKAILMSVKPEECEKIFSGVKTILEIKTATKLKPPFKVYVYQTKNRRGNKVVNEVLDAVYGSGKVVGEFVCDKMNYKWKSRFSNGRITSIKRENDLYIDDPKRYYTPKELGEFYTLGNCEKYDFCNQCKNFHRGQGWLDGSYYDEDSCIDNTRIPVTRPPQSWCYVEEIEE